MCGSDACGPQVKTVAEYNKPEVWLKIGKCHKALGNIEDAKSILEDVRHNLASL